MLVLTRKAKESVVIGNTVRVVVLETGSGCVKLGFDAPPDTSIYREELHCEIAQANRAAMDAAEGQAPGAPPEDYCTTNSENRTS
jgi:carbon storage regulator